MLLLTDDGNLSSRQSIESSVWVPVLEELYEMWGVRFHDSTGEFWRPRLKLLS